MSFFGKNKQSNQSQSGTLFPFQFMDEYTDLFGMPPGTQQLWQNPPQTSSLFGMPAPRFGAQRQPAPDGQTGTPAPTQPAPEGQAGPPLFTIKDVESTYARLRGTGKTGDIERLIRKAGLDPSGFTVDEWYAAVRNAKGLSGTSKGLAMSAGADLERQAALKQRAQEAYGAQQPGGGMFVQQPQPENPFYTDFVAPHLGALTPMSRDQQQQMFHDLFSGAPQVTAPEISLTGIDAAGATATGAGATGATATGATATGAIAQGFGVDESGLTFAAPIVNQAQMSFAPGGYDAWQAAAFKSIADPAVRRLQQQQDEALKQQQTALANAGLLSSGAGQTQVAQTQKDYLEQQRATLSEASHNAAVMRYGYEFQEQYQNARMRHEANMEQARLDLAARQASAQNLLTARVATAENLTSASIASSRNLTDASIASARNLTDASIASARNLTDASIASARNRTEANIRQAELQLAAQQSNQAAYLKAYELTSNEARAARDDFLRLLGIAQMDLSRMDSFTLQSTSLAFDAYLSQFSATAQAGRYSQSRSESKQTSGWGSLLSGGFGQAFGEWLFSR